jgi:hypothetical protein
LENPGFGLGFLLYIYVVKNTKSRSFIVKKFTVTEDTEVILNNKKYLLEAGDVISLESIASLDAIDDKDARFHSTVSLDDESYKDEIEDVDFSDEYSVDDAGIDIDRFYSLERKLKRLSIPAQRAGSKLLGRYNRTINLIHSIIKNPDNFIDVLDITADRLEQMIKELEYELSGYGV